MIATTFKDVMKEQEMEKNGYTLIPNFLSANDVSELLKLYKSLHVNWKQNSGQWNSVSDLSSNKAQETSATILSYLKDKADCMFDNCYLPVGTFLSKYPGTQSMCDMHRDFSLLDETKYEYRNIWIPLIDITETNGVLFVLPGSHKSFNEILPMTQPWMHRQHIPLLANYIKPIYAKAGDLIVYKDKMIHGSFQNLTTDTRPVIHLGALPQQAQIYFYYLNGKQVEVYAVKPDYFFRNDLGQPPLNVAPTWVLDYKYNTYSTEEMKALVSKLV